jgi:hypothetical protein
MRASQDIPAQWTAVGPEQLSSLKLFFIYRDSREFEYC